MFLIDGPIFQSVISGLPSSKFLELRGKGHELVRDVTRHEIEILLAKKFVVGQSNKRGLQYVQLTVGTRTAMALLRQTVRQEGSTVAEDNRTVSKQYFGEGRVVFSHRGDMTNAWSRRKHWSNWGAQGRGARAVVAVPRHV